MGCDHKTRQKPKWDATAEGGRGRWIASCELCGKMFKSVGFKGFKNKIKFVKNLTDN